MALSVREPTGALGVSANEDEEDRAMEETDGYSHHLEEDEGADEAVEHRAERRKRTSCWGWCRALWSHMRVNLRSIVESKYFNRGIMIAILINTISMGIEHHDQVISQDDTHCNTKQCECKPLPVDTSLKFLPEEEACIVVAANVRHLVTPLQELSKLLDSLESH